MSTTVAPVIKLPRHSVSNALEVLFEGHLSSSEINAFKSICTASQWDAVNGMAENILHKWDKYMVKVAGELWHATSFLTGNTRGAIKQEGTTYPDSDIVFDEALWFAEKTLPTLKQKVVYRSWTSKKTGEEHSKRYVYPAGRLVKITGEDYAPRIPMPNHGGGFVDALVETYEEMKADAYTDAGFHLK